jgi:hypothetical protein
MQADHEEEIQGLIERPGAQALIAAMKKLDAAAVRIAIEAAPDECGALLRRAEEAEQADNDFWRATSNLDGLGWRPFRLGGDFGEARGLVAREMIEALAGGGWRPDAQRLGIWLHVAMETQTDMETLELIERLGGFEEEARRAAERTGGSLQAHGLAKTLAARGTRERALFGRLAASGAIGNADKALFSAAELLSRGQWALAQDLVDAGHPAAVVERTSRSGQMKPESIEEFLQWRVARAHRWGAPEWPAERERPMTPQERAQEAEDALAGVRQLAAWGVPLQRVDDLRNEKPGSAIFASLFGSANLRWNRGATEEMVKAVGPELIKMGVDPSDGDALAECLAKACRSLSNDAAQAKRDKKDGRASAPSHDYPQSLDAMAQWAVEHGLDLRSRAGLMHTTITGLDVEDKNGGTPYRDSIERLERWGVRLADIAPVGPTPLALCLRDRHFKVASALIERGAPFAYECNGEGPLHALAASANGPGLRALDAALARPEAGALINQSSNDPERMGETPLHQACAALSLESMRRLLDAGADPNAKDAKGWTPIRHALRLSGKKAQEKASEAIVLLIGRGADPALTDHKGLTAAQSAAATAPMRALADLLRARPQDVLDGKKGAETRKKLGARGDGGQEIAAIVEQEALSEALRETKRRAGPNATGSMKDPEPPSPGGAPKAKAEAAPAARRRPRSL